MLIGRLQSLGHAHELLTETSWMGADLKDIVQAEIAGFSERVRFSGPTVSLSPSGVQTFALIVHELSTNAAKYGALSSANGEVVVDWQLGGSGNGRYMEFSWRESGGPPVVPDHARRLRPVADQRHGQQRHLAAGHRVRAGGLLLHAAGAARDDRADPLRPGLADARRRPSLRRAGRAGGAGGSTDSPATVVIGRLRMSSWAKRCGASSRWA